MVQNPPSGWECASHPRHVPLSCAYDAPATLNGLAPTAMWGTRAGVLAVRVGATAAAGSRVESQEAALARTLVRRALGPRS